MAFTSPSFLRRLNRAWLAAQSSSGGWVYHLRAFLYRDALWGAHRAGVRKLLSEWNPKAETLVLLGPSAGYSLPVETLTCFSKLVVVEPDPLANWFSHLRGHPNLVWLSNSIFEMSESDVQNVCGDRAAILFCNFLGQLDLRDHPDWQSVFCLWTEGRPWASYHDAWSGRDFEWLDSGEPQFLPRKKLASDTDRSNSLHSLLRTAGNQIEIHQHLAYDLFQEKEHRNFAYWAWRITPRNTQIIEAVYETEKPARFSA